MDWYRGVGGGGGGGGRSPKIFHPPPPQLEMYTSPWLLQVLLDLLQKYVK